MRNLVETDYILNHGYNLTLAIVADAHLNCIDEFIFLLRRRNPDLILIPGDLVNGAQIKNSDNHSQYLQRAIALLNQISEIAPTFFSIGNHEKRLSPLEIEELYVSKAELLQERYTKLNTNSNVIIGGLSSGNNYFKSGDNQQPDIGFISEFEKENGFKILLSHHPEYYGKYLKNTKIDLIISGHAHGGQIRVLNRGLYAPGQGIFPQYTSGIYDGKLVVSRGIAGTEIIPRINNKPEIVYVKI